MTGVMLYTIILGSSLDYSHIISLQGMKIPSYDNQLLNLAEDLARRLLPAFETPTGIATGWF